MLPVARMEPAVKRVGKFLVAPLQLMLRPVALVAAALLLIGAWGLAAFLQTAQEARDALGGLTVSASAAAASVDVLLGQFADITDGFRPADFQNADRVALTSRLLRLQSALPSVGATFAVSSSGQLLAASSPFSANDASVGDADWFRRAMADSAMPLALQRANSWLRPGPAAVLTRVVRDPAGKATGLIGAELRTEDLARLLAHTWLGPGVSIDFRDVGNSLILPGQIAPPQPLAAPAGQDDWLSGTGLLTGLNRVLGIPAQLSVTEPLRSVDVTVTARVDPYLALESHWLGRRAVGILGGYLLAVWVTCLVLAVAARSNRDRPAPVPPVGFGADWQAIWTSMAA